MLFLILFFLCGCRSNFSPDFKLNKTFYEFLLYKSTDFMQSFNEAYNKIYSYEKKFYLITDIAVDNYIIQVQSGPVITDFTNNSKIPRQFKMDYVIVDLTYYKIKFTNLVMHYIYNQEEREVWLDTAEFACKNFYEGLASYIDFLITEDIEHNKLTAETITNENLL